MHFNQHTTSGICFFCSRQVAEFVITNDWQRMTGACANCCDYLARTLPDARSYWLMTVEDAAELGAHGEGWRMGRAWRLVRDIEAEATAERVDAWLRGAA